MRRRRPSRADRNGGRASLRTRAQAVRNSNRPWSRRSFASAAAIVPRLGAGASTLGSSPRAKDEPHCSTQLESFRRDLLGLSLTAKSYHPRLMTKVVASHLSKYGGHQYALSYAHTIMAANAHQRNAQTQRLPDPFGIPIRTASPVPAASVPGL